MSSRSMAFDGGERLLAIGGSPADSGRRRANDYEEDEEEDFVSRKLLPVNQRMW